MKRPTDSLLPLDYECWKSSKEPCIIIQEVKKEEEPSLPVQGGFVAQLNNVSNTISKMESQEEEEGSWRETEERKDEER